MTGADAVVARLRETDARSGGRRVAWTGTWAAERERVDALARELAPDVLIETDAFANRWYVLPGRSRETVLVGSHIDCVPGGGWLDGILGVHAGLAILGALDAPPDRTLAVVDWADEEGARFGRSLLGSGAATGILSAAELGALRDAEGAPAPQIVAAHGFDAGALGAPSPRLADVVAAVELHIEQGPVLEREGRPVGAVSGCLGVRRLRFTLTGAAGHAGATPMDRRRDPVRAAAEAIAAIGAAAEDARGLATVGTIAAEPAVPTAIAERCTFTLDLRHADAEPLGALEQAAGAAVDAAAAARACTVARDVLWSIEPVRFDPALVERAVRVTGGGAPLVSGPLHDSAALAQHGIPTVMLFTPSIGGVSHARAEDTADGDLVAGIAALDALVRELLTA